MENSKSESKSIVKGAMSLFAASLSSSPIPVEAQKTPSVEKSPLDIPKEELMALCMKMNKRMNVLESKSSELLRRNSRLLEERRRLKDLISSTTSTPSLVNDDENLDLDHLVDGWEKWNKNNRQKIRQLENKLADLESRCSAVAGDELSNQFPVNSVSIEYYFKIL